MINSNLTVSILWFDVTGEIPAVSNSLKNLLNSASRGINFHLILCLCPRQDALNELYVNYIFMM